MIVLLIIYLLLFAFLMATVYIERFEKYHTLAKTAASLGFIAVAVYGWLQSGDTRFFLTMIPALLFCLAGDFFLSLPSADEFGLGFIAGLLTFAIGHLLFLVAFLKMAPIVWPELLFPLVMVALVYLVTRSPRFDVGNFTIPVLIYGFLVAWTFSRSVVILLDAGIAARTLCLLVGSLLFMVSDIVLLFVYFYEKKFSWMSFVNLSTYYGGMFLLALSIYF